MSKILIQDYKFKNEALLDLAFTHSSFSKTNNERLEFLGDSVLNLVITKYLFENYPELDEGKMSRVRSNLVNQETLSSLSKKLELQKNIKLSAGEEKTNGREKKSILSNTFEALIGAIYLDSDLDVVFNYIKKVYGDLLTNANLIKNNKDPKSILQEYCQGRFLPLPNYNTKELNDKVNTFETVCSIDGIKDFGYGKGNTKKNSHQSAAEKMLEQLKIYFD